MTGVAMAVLAHAVGAELDFRILVLARASLALLVAWAMARGTGISLDLGNAKPMMWLRSLLGAVIMVACFYAYSVLPASDVVVLFNTSPLFLALVAWGVLGHAPRPSAAGAVLVGFCGVILLERPHLATGGFAVGLTLAASAGVAVVTMLIARLRSVPSPLVVGHFVLVTLALDVALLFVPLGERVVSFAPLRQPWVCAALAGVGLSGAVSQLLYTRACQMGRASRVAVTSVAQVPMTLAVDVLLGARTLDGWAWAGLALVVGPVVFLLLHPSESTHAVVVHVAFDTRDAAPSADARASAEGALRRAIEHLERATSCELRIHVEPTGTPSERVLRERFTQLGMHATARRNSLLLVVWPATGAVGLLADEGISDVFSRRSLARSVTRASPEWVAHVEATVARLAATLADAFPHPPDDRNELPDEISWGGP